MSLFCHLCVPSGQTSVGTFFLGLGVPVPVDRANDVVLYRYEHSNQTLYERRWFTAAGNQRNGVNGVRLQNGHEPSFVPRSTGTGFGDG